VSCAKTAEPINAVWDAKWFGPKEASIRWDAHWRNLVNTNEPSICGGDAALSSYFDHVLTVRHVIYLSIILRIQLMREVSCRVRDVTGVRASGFERVVLFVHVRVIVSRLG